MLHFGIDSSQTLAVLCHSSGARGHDAQCRAQPTIARLRPRILTAGGGAGQLKAMSAQRQRNRGMNSLKAFHAEKYCSSNPFSTPLNSLPRTAPSAKRLSVALQYLEARRYASRI